MNLLLKNLSFYSDGKFGSADLRVGRRIILEFSRAIVPRRREMVLNLSGYIAFPGLINSHDHLEFNLFPRLGHPPYSTFYEWAGDIYHPSETPVKEILQVSIVDRLWWGAFKNLVSGVTTVAHHGPYYRRIFRRRFPIRVTQKYGWSHSLGHGNEIKRAFAGSHGKPYIIHAGEGTDVQSSEEIDKLAAMGLLQENTILVHGVAVRPDQIDVLTNSGVSLVWCPASNIFLFSETADITQLRGRVRVTLGTDSTMSGSPTLFAELRAAHKTGLASSKELLEMVTATAATIFRLSDGQGSLSTGSPADLIVLPDSGKPPEEILLNASPGDLALVLVNGFPRLANEPVAEMLNLGSPNACVDAMPKWMYGNMNALRNRIREQVGEEILSRNPLWNVLKEKEPHTSSLNQPVIN